MGEKGVSALIVASPGPLQDGLCALLAAMPQIARVTEADALSSALGALNGSCPSLVILDADASKGETWPVVREIKAKWPQSCCIVLANDVAQQHDAETAGADAALLKGVPAARIMAEVLRLVALGPV